MGTGDTRATPIQVRLQQNITFSPKFGVRAGIYIRLCAKELVANKNPILTVHPMEQLIRQTAVKPGRNKCLSKHIPVHLNRIIPLRVETFSEGRRGVPRRVLTRRLRNMNAGFLKTKKGDGVWEVV